MRKSILAALIGSAFALGPVHAGLTIDLNGANAGGVITADALDWAPTSFLAQGGNTAISAFVGSGGACTAVGGVNPCSFDVLTHAKLTGYLPTGGGSFLGLPAFGGEITMVARYTETVTGFGFLGPNPAASFASTGAGWVEFYFSGADSDNLTGSAFNNGTLIGRLSGVEVGKTGTFTVTNMNEIPLDATADGDQYPGQATVSGTGSQDSLQAGTAGVDLDPSFFLTTIAGFALNYDNISIGLPYRTVNPSDCFNPTMAAAMVGTSGLASTCDAAHQLAPYAGQVNPTGYTPVVGPTNGLALGFPDFVAQTDFNSSVAGSVPEPGSLALVGLALGALGFAARRRA